VKVKADIFEIDALGHYGWAKFREVKLFSSSRMTIEKPHRSEGIGTLFLRIDE
jgi:hypothetical protein